MKTPRKLKVLLLLVLTTFYFNDSEAQNQKTSQSSTSESVADFQTEEATVKTIPNNVSEIGKGPENAKRAYNSFQATSPIPELNSLRQELITLNYKVEMNQIENNLNSDEIKEILAVKIPELEKRIERLLPKEQVLLQRKQTQVKQ
jgi:hypothetical protein